MKDRIVHAQTVLYERDLNKLKELTKTETTKDALRIAVEYYLKTFGDTYENMYIL